MSSKNRLQIVFIYEEKVCNVIGSWYEYFQKNRNNLFSTRWKWEKFTDRVPSDDHRYQCNLLLDTFFSCSHMSEIFKVIVIIASHSLYINSYLISSRILIKRHDTRTNIQLSDRFSICALRKEMSELNFTVIPRWHMRLVHGVRWK